ncbi:MAG: hypothetical protein ACLUDU_09270 [Butyricimonas faecihominis]
MLHLRRLWCRLPTGCHRDHENREARKVQATYSYGLTVSNQRNMIWPVEGNIELNRKSMVYASRYNAMQWIV